MRFPRAERRERGGGAELRARDDDGVARAITCSHRLVWANSHAAAPKARSVRNSIRAGCLPRRGNDGTHFRASLRRRTHAPEPPPFPPTMASEMQKGTFAVKVGLAQVRLVARPRAFARPPDPDEKPSPPGSRFFPGPMPSPKRRGANPRVATGRRRSRPRARTPAPRLHDHSPSVPRALAPAVASRAPARSPVPAPPSLAP